ncbi:unnamed protein product [Adineta ricciae]|uniref:Uncharacterized protein n=1 Tax=Adineta ricciae TaxID=249248 RepID=A0A816ABR8_ADIRI|nr:unnamed protein product [Adineta ricciae]CAF1593819.1 unnamed protein product [Adineta ricciae]
MANPIHDAQIDILLNGTKQHMEKLTKKYLTSPLTIDPFDLFFRELIEYLEGFYQIMSNVCKNVSGKTNRVLQENRTLLDQVNQVVKSNGELRTNNDQLSEEIKGIQARMQARER